MVGIRDRRLAASTYPVLHIYPGIQCVDKIQVPYRGREYIKLVAETSKDRQLACRDTQRSETVEYKTLAGNCCYLRRAATVVYLSVLI